MALNFADAAKKKLADIERPPLPPVGSYRFRVSKIPEVSTSKDGRWDILTISCRAVEAIDADMSDYKGEVTGIMMQRKFMFNKEDEAEFDRTMFNCRQFFEKHLGVADPKNSIAEAMQASVNGEFLGTVSWSQDKEDAEIFYANLNRTAPLE